VNSIFLEQFTPDRTLKPTIKEFWRVFDDFQNDNRYKIFLQSNTFFYLVVILFFFQIHANRFEEWSCDLRDFVELMLKRPQELDEDIAYERAKDFVERGRILFKDYQHREDVKRFSILNSQFSMIITITATTLA
jgi:hypothetical protein